jgi:hypothetical protein
MGCCARIGPAAWALTLKENQPELLREAERFTTGPPAEVQSNPKQELRCWHVPELDSPIATSSILPSTKARP